MVFNFAMTILNVHITEMYIILNIWSR